MDREQRIREIAYQLWVDEGYPVDQEERHWRMAEIVFAQEEASRALGEAKKPEEGPRSERTTKAAA
jgi:hypothetical protein